MSASLQLIQELREKIGQAHDLGKKEFFRSSLLPLGIPRGSLVEVCGAQRTEWLVAFLLENPTLHCFWFEREQTVFPTGLHQRGVDLAKVTFGIVPEPFRAMREVLRKQLHEVVIAPHLFTEERVLRSLQLAAKDANAAVFLTDKTPKPAWALSVQLEAFHDESGTLAVNVTKHRLAGISCG